MSLIRVIRLFQMPKVAKYFLRQSKQASPSHKYSSINQTIPNHQHSKALEEHIREVQANYFLERRTFL